MAGTPTLCESSIDDTEAVVTVFKPRLDDPDFSETPTLASELAGLKPVSWDGPHDLRNPQNWSASRKWLVMSVNAIITVNVYVLWVSCPNLQAKNS